MKNSIRGFMYLCVITLFTACVLNQLLEINQYAINFKLKEINLIVLYMRYIEEPSVIKALIIVRFFIQLKLISLKSML